MIRLSQVYKTYPGGQESLRNLSLHIPRGQMTFVTGHSGAGKSTLLRLLALMERHTRGQVIIDGQNLERIARRKIPYYRRTVGYIFQDHRLLPDRTIFDNVALPLVIAGYRRPDIIRRVRAALDKLGLIEKEKKYPETLSSGQQQRVGIARAVVNKPALLLADEPTGNLDPELSLEIMKFFDLFSQVGVTVVIATHEREMIDSMTHPIIELKDGQLL